MERLLRDYISDGYEYEYLLKNCQNDSKDKVPVPLESRHIKKKQN